MTVELSDLPKLPNNWEWEFDELDGDPVAFTIAGPYGDKTCVYQSNVGMYDGNLYILREELTPIPFEVFAAVDKASRMMDGRDKR